jgi:hypothetical protein
VLVHHDSFATTYKALLLLLLLGVVLVVVCSRYNDPDWQMPEAKQGAAAAATAAALAASGGVAGAGHVQASATLCCAELCAVLCKFNKV